MFVSDLWNVQRFSFECTGSIAILLNIYGLFMHIILCHSGENRCRFHAFALFIFPRFLLIFAAFFDKLYCHTKILLHESQLSS